MALQPAALLTLGTGAITAGGLAAPPAAGLGPASVGAVECLGSGRPEPAFAALEQTAATAERLGSGCRERLTAGREPGRLKGAQGRQLPEGQVSGGGGNLLPRRCSAATGLERGTEGTSLEFTRIASSSSAANGATSRDQAHALARAKDGATGRDQASAPWPGPKRAFGLIQNRC